MPDRIYYSKEAETLARRQQAITALAFFTLGVGVGATVALLFVPQEEIRQLIGEALDEGLKRGREATGEVLKQLEPDYPDLRARFENTLESLRR